MGKGCGFGPSCPLDPKPPKPVLPFHTEEPDQHIVRGLVRAVTSGAFKRVVVIRILWDSQLPDAPIKRESDMIVKMLSDLHHHDTVDVVLPVSKEETRKNLCDARALVHFADRVAEIIREMTKATDHVIVYYRGHGSPVDKPNDILLE